MIICEYLQEYLLPEQRGVGILREQACKWNTQRVAWPLFFTSQNNAETEKLFFLFFYFTFFPSRWGGILTISREKPFVSFSTATKWPLALDPQLQNRQKKNSRLLTNLYCNSIPFFFFFESAFFFCSSREKLARPENIFDSSPDKTIQENIF